MRRKILVFTGLLLAAIGCFISLLIVAETLFYNVDMAKLPYFIGSVAAMFIGVCILGKYDTIAMDVNEEGK